MHNPTTAMRNVVRWLANHKRFCPHESLCDLKPKGVFKPLLKSEKAITPFKNRHDVVMSLK
jgi:hypothetical protein